MKIKNFSDYVNQINLNEKLELEGDEKNVLKPISHAEQKIYSKMRAGKNFCIETKNQTSAITLVEYYAKQMGAEPVELFAGKDIKSKEDVSGVPTTGGKIAIPKWALTIKDNQNKNYIVLLVGEFEQELQTALMTTVEGQIGGYDISKNCKFVLICENAKSLGKPLLAILNQRVIEL